MAVSGSTVYAGGQFTSIGGQTRNRIAALDATTGAATDWNPNAGGGTYPTVLVLAASGSTVYAGGNFTSIGGQTRNSIAALSAATGNATAWNPNAGGPYPTVSALAVSGSTVYAAGFFTSIGGQTRNGIAALNSATGLATDWDPNASDSAYNLTVSGSIVYAVGSYWSIGGQNRRCIAALSAFTGAATAWDPKAYGSGFYPDSFSVFSLAVSDSAVYVGGEFSTIGGQLRPCFAQFARKSAARSWKGYE